MTETTRRSCLNLSKLIAPQTNSQLAAFLCLLSAFSFGMMAHSQSLQSPPVTRQVIGHVVDASGAVIPGARITDPTTGKLMGVTDSTGTISLSCVAQCIVRIDARGFKSADANWHDQPSMTLQIDPRYSGYQGPCCFDQPLLPTTPLPVVAEVEPVQSPPSPPTPNNVIPPVREVVTVTAYRTPLGDLESPVSTRTLSAQDLQQAAPITLDGQLREIPGVETFRRSSSLVANPSSQGLSLRGLGSTSASRTLVTEDDVPLNDAFAGWIHWEELPELSIHSIEVVRGGASDLYGSSAIGGVVNVLANQPTSNLAELQASFGSENTYQDSLLVQTHRGRWGALATAGVLGTDGFIQTAPDQRGTVDIYSNVHAQNGLVLLDRRWGDAQHPLRIFARASALNEARNNGTPLQTNGTRLWRYATGADWSQENGGNLTLRAYGSTQHYRQTFSTILAGRNSETLNRFARTPDDELGLVLHWSKPLTPGLLLLVGADTHDVRALDAETTISMGTLGYVDLNDRQRQTGVYAELLYTRSAWTVSGAGRFDWFSNFDGQRWLPAQAQLPHDAERVFDPRLGLSRKLGQHFALSATGFRAYRAPTPNELYRSTQVGSLLTLPNNNLSSERATGWEAGIAMQQGWGTLRTSYFWTRVNHPITALTINATSNPIKLMRENLGQIESRGVSFDAEVRPVPSLRWLTAQGGYQYTNATVTQYAQQPNLVGNWIPQVAHNMGTLQLRGTTARIGTLSLQARMSGRQFDDDANTYLLHSYFRLDAYASHDFGQHVEVFTAGENLFDRTIEVGRTPTLTLGTPCTVRFGMNLKLTPGAK